MKKSKIKGIAIIFLILIAISISYISYYYYLVESANAVLADSTCYSNSTCDIEKVNLSIEKYLKAEKLYDEPFVYENCGLAYYYNKKYLFAYSQLNTAIGIKNRFPLYEKIKSFVSLGLYEPTDWEIKQILLYYTLGDISTKLGNYNQCIDDYTKMFKVATQQGKDALEREKRGFCYYKLGMYQEAYDDCVNEKEWLNNRISNLPDNKLKDAYINRVKKIDNLLVDISKADGNN